MQKTRSRLRDRGSGLAHARRWAAVGRAVLLALVCGATGRSQFAGGGGTGQNAGGRTQLPLGTNRSTTITDDENPVLTERRLLAFNIERQKQMVADSEKLLKLAKELNDEVAAGNKGEWTLDQLHKIAEIEKLARNVRERMTHGVGEPASFFSQPLQFPDP
jgi:hypothetical protein